MVEKVIAVKAAKSPYWRLNKNFGTMSRAYKIYKGAVITPPLSNSHLAAG